MKKYSVPILSALFSLIVVIWSCKHPLPDKVDYDIPGNTGRQCDSDSVYFANDILPLLTSSCATSKCHDVISHKEDIQITNYSNIMELVVPSNASNSKLYKVITETGKDRMPEPPNPALTAEQIAMIKKWIDQGAKNNACDKCDTLDFKFSTAVKPLIDLKCKGCHNPASLGGGVDLSSYIGVKAIADNGKLYGTVSWGPGFKTMPQGTVKMPACEILQLKKWAEAGAPNN